MLVPEARRGQPLGATCTYLGTGMTRAPRPRAGLSHPEPDVC